MPQCKWRWSGSRHDSTAPIEFILEEVILTWLDLKMIFMIFMMVLLSEFFFWSERMRGPRGYQWQRIQRLIVTILDVTPSPFPQWVCYVTTPLTEW